MSEKDLSSIYSENYERTVKELDDGENHYLYDPENVEAWIRSDFYVDILE